ncbi:MAG: hypothetical protein WCL39_12220 [Armatimonadota bacterium]
MTAQQRVLELSRRPLDEDFSIGISDEEMTMLETAALAVLARMSRGEVS